MYGVAHIHLPGVNINSSSEQTITPEAEKQFRAAASLQIPVEIHDMMASSIGVGAVRANAVHEYGDSIVGNASGQDFTVGSGKITFVS